jgi:hypothetical protein
VAIEDNSSKLCCSKIQNICGFVSTVAARQSLYKDVQTEFLRTKTCPLLRVIVGLFMATATFLENKYKE